MPQPRPLDGVRVLDLSQIIAGPVCGRVLADLGAEVIKVEAPGGDLSRIVPPSVEGIGALYAQMNAGKRHLCVDLRAEGGAALVARLAQRCDVLLENFRPGALRGRGLGFGDLSSANPRLVYCSISGFGQDGPWSDRRAHAPLLHAEGGTIETAARLRGTPPAPEVHQHADLYSGFFAVSAICAALYQRERTGAGQHLDIALAEALLYANDHAAVDLLGHDGAREFDTWTYPVVSLPSGEVVCLIGNPLRLFDRWMQALGRPDAARPADEAAARDTVAEAASSFADAAALHQALEAHGMLSARVQSIQELVESEWALHRGVIRPAAPGVGVPAAPWRSSGATIGVAGEAATVGAHSGEVLAEVLGMDAGEIEALVAAGVVRT